MNKSESEPLLTVPQAAEYLQVSDRTIWRYIEIGQIEAKRLGPRMVRISKAAIEALIERNSNGNNS